MSKRKIPAATPTAAAAAPATGEVAARAETVAAVVEAAAAATAPVLPSDEERQAVQAIEAFAQASAEAAAPIVPAAPLPSQPSDQDELAALGLTIDDDGLVSLELLTGLSGPDICLSAKDAYRCGPAEAIRFVRGELAIPGARD